MTHGDLIPGNVLVSHGRLAGVIDVGGLGPADPALDLVGAWHLLEPGPRQALRADLGSDDLEWARGRAWAFEQAMGAVWYYTGSNPAMVSDWDDALSDGSPPISCEEGLPCWHVPRVGDTWWASPGPYGSHLLTSYYAIKVYGPGHVIAHNAIAYFHDGLGISTYGTPEKDPERQASSIDIYGNDIHMSNDDIMETDGGVHNVRVFENRGINAAQGGYSSQPVFGGPIYFYRNILYNVPTGVAFKFSAKPAGMFVYHNTIISEQTMRDPYANAHFRNNLFLGRDYPDRAVMAWANATGAYSSDYDGFRPNRSAPNNYVWLAPQPGKDAYEPEARRVEELQDAGRFPRRDRAGDTRDRTRFRYLREPVAARRLQPASRLSLDGFELPPEAGQ